MILNEKDGKSKVDWEKVRVKLASVAGPQIAEAMAERLQNLALADKGDIKRVVVLLKNHGNEIIPAERIRV
jgi:hypothetical protein